MRQTNSHGLDFCANLAWTTFENFRLLWDQNENIIYGTPFSKNKKIIGQ